MYIYILYITFLDMYVLNQLASSSRAFFKRGEFHDIEDPRTIYES